MLLLAIGNGREIGSAAELLVANTIHCAPMLAPGSGRTFRETSRPESILTRSKTAAREDISD